MWLVRELRAQLGRLGLGLGVLSAGLIATGTVFAVGNWEPGYGFIVLELGASGLAVAGLLLLVPSAAPKRRRRRIPGREAVVWL